MKTQGEIEAALCEVMRHSDPAIVRFAVIGLGHFAQTAMLSAFANANDMVSAADRADVP